MKDSHKKGEEKAKYKNFKFGALKNEKGKSDTGSCLARLAYCGSRIPDIRHGPSVSSRVGEQGIKRPGKKVVVIKGKEAKRRNS